MPGRSLYVVAGPNGIGKTTCTFDLIPRGIPIINSDEIAKQAKLSGKANVNLQEYSNREAMLLVDQHLKNEVDFAIETNLADEETWKFLRKLRQQGWIINLLFMCTDDLELLNKRIEERHQRGEHFVRPDIVEERYFTALKLLSHYFSTPNNIQLIDNSDETIIVGVKNGQEFKIVSNFQPGWVNNFNAHLNKDSTPDKRTLDMSIDEIKKSYHERLKNKK